MTSDDVKVTVCVPEKFRYRLATAGHLGAPSSYRLHTEDEITCPSQRDGSGDIHREHVCEDCAAWRLARMTPAGVEDLYYAGRLDQDSYEAYMLGWRHLKPTGGVPLESEYPVVLRITRKIVAFHKESSDE